MSKLAAAGLLAAGGIAYALSPRGKKKDAATKTKIQPEEENHKDDDVTDGFNTSRVHINNFRSQSDMTSNSTNKLPSRSKSLRRESHVIGQNHLGRLSRLVNLTSTIRQVTAKLRKNDDRIQLQIDVEDKQKVPGLSIVRENIGQHVESHNDSKLRVPKLNVVIMIVGTQGDVKPFVHLGQQLKNTHGHRVRLATHEKFRDTVRRGGLEFYPLGGDPEKLASYSSSNKIIPTSFEEADEKLGIMREIIFSTYGAATAKDPFLASYIHELNDVEKLPFTADAIISNPPTYGHIHVAQALNIPLHMYFTMPWTPTVEFSHPMAVTFGSSKTENYLSYHAMNNMTWIGLRPIINDFRESVLNLKPIQIGENGGSLLDKNNIPFAYTWSPTLVPRPKDWHKNCDVVGFFHTKGDPNAPVPSYAKDRERIELFLQNGEPPIFFGFGSCTLGKTTIEVRLVDPVLNTTSLKIVQFGDAVRAVDENVWVGTTLRTAGYTKENLHLMDLESRREVFRIKNEEAKGDDWFLKLTHCIIKAITATGKRAIIQRGWGGLGYDRKGNAVDLPDSIIAIGPEAHTWLFERVAAVVHHGGAGTCAAGLLAGRPTMVCSFCLDQPFWGAAVEKHRFGAPTKPVREVTADDLIDAIDNYLYDPTVLDNCMQAAVSMDKEDGVTEGVRSFHKHLRRYYKENKKFGVHRPQNPCSGMYQGLFSGISLLIVAIVQLLCLPFLIISAMSEKLADGLRFGEFRDDEKEYDEIDGLVDGCCEGAKSCWYSVRSAFTCDSEGGAVPTICGVLTKPIGGIFDLCGKICEGLLRSVRMKKGRYRGQLTKTKNQQEKVKQVFNLIQDTQALYNDSKED
jgi:UDP:flavonoid glycosyltransferase YjiC (YdhE family)